MKVRVIPGLCLMLAASVSFQMPVGFATKAVGSAKQSGYEGRPYGDFNNDRTVDVLDFSLLTQQWRTLYNVADFNSLALHWGQRITEGADEHGDTPDAASPVTPGVDQDGEIHGESDTDWFSFAGESGAIYSILVEAVPGPWPSLLQIEVLDEDGETVIAASEAGVTDYPLTHQALYTGSHFVRISGLDGGLYRLRVTQEFASAGGVGALFTESPDSLYGIASGDDGWTLAVYGARTAQNLPAGVDRLVVNGPDDDAYTVEFGADGVPAMILFSDGTVIGIANWHDGAADLVLHHPDDSIELLEAVPIGSKDLLALTSYSKQAMAGGRKLSPAQLGRLIDDALVITELLICTGVAVYAPLPPLVNACIISLGSTLAAKLIKKAIADPIFGQAIDTIGLANSLRDCLLTANYRSRACIKFALESVQNAAQLVSLYRNSDRANRLPTVEVTVAEVRLDATRVGQSITVSIDPPIIAWRYALEGPSEHLSAVGATPDGGGDLFIRANSFPDTTPYESTLVITTEPHRVAGWEGTTSKRVRIFTYGPLLLDPDPARLTLDPGTPFRIVHVESRYDARDVRWEVDAIEDSTGARTDVVTAEKSDPGARLKISAQDVPGVYTVSLRNLDNRDDTAIVEVTVSSDLPIAAMPTQVVLRPTVETRTPWASFRVESLTDQPYTWRIASSRQFGNDPFLWIEPTLASRERAMEHYVHINRFLDEAPVTTLTLDARLLNSDTPGAPVEVRIVNTDLVLEHEGSPAPNPGGFALELSYEDPVLSFDVSNGGTSPNWYTGASSTLRWAVEQTSGTPSLVIEGGGNPVNSASRTPMTVRIPQDWGYGEERQIALALWNLDDPDADRETVTITLRAGGSVDLAMREIYLGNTEGNDAQRITSPVAGQAIYFHSLYRANGIGPVSGKLRTFYLNGQLFCERTASVTAPGDYFGSCGPWFAVAGEHELTVLLDPDDQFRETDETNNEMTYRFTVSEPMDLNITEVFVGLTRDRDTPRVSKPIPGQQVYLHIRYVISGAGNWDGTTWELSLNGETRCSSTPENVGPGIWFGNCVTPWTATLGTHQLCGRLDIQNIIAETDETNNEACITFGVSEGNGPDEVFVDTRTPTFSARDHGTIDGDIVSIYLNGSSLGQMTLTASFQDLTLNLNAGQNTVTVVAVNVGSISPNTGSFRISNVVGGPQSQEWRAQAGDSISFYVTPIN